MKICYVDNCKNNVDAKDLCPTHYNRLKRHGNFDSKREVKRKEIESRTCSVDGCKKPYKQSGFCSKHSSQMYWHGKILKRTIYTANEIVTDGEVSYIILYDRYGKEKARTKIDTEDISRIRGCKWSLGGVGYAECVKHKQTLHRFINRTPKKLETDHLNEDKLDNRKCNLRSVTRSQNCMNRKGIEGVSYRKDRKKWVAQLVVNKKRVLAKSFPTYEEAREARINAEQKYFKDFAPKRENYTKH